MAICADYHLHSSFSGDSDTPIEDMIKEAIRLGLKQICFTEHQDFDYPPAPDIPADFFLVNTDSYLYDLLCYKEKYAKQIVEVLRYISQIAKEEKASASPLWLPPLPEVIDCNMLIQKYQYRKNSGFVLNPVVG